MNDRDPEERRLQVPFEVAPFLRAPYGWTNRMRRAEGHPGRGERHPVRLGPWATLAWALAIYAPPTVGAGIGWRTRGGWLGAVLGVLVALTVQLLVALAAIPAVALFRRRFRRARTGCENQGSAAGSTPRVTTRRTPWARPDASVAAARRRPPTTASAPTRELTRGPDTRSPRTGDRSGASCRVGLSCRLSSR